MLLTKMGTTTSSKGAGCSAMRLTANNNWRDQMSPKLKIDASTAKEFEVIPEGTYPATLEKVHPVKKGPNSNYCRVDYKINDGEFEKRTLIQNAPVDGDGAGIFLAIVNAATGSDLKPGDEYDIDTDDLEGMEVRLIVGQREYQGEMKNEVKRVLPA